MNYRIAVGTSDDIDVTEHFGRCTRFHIYEINKNTEAVVSVEIREIDRHNEAGACGGHNQERILRKIRDLEDCQIVLVAKIGGQSEKMLLHQDITPLQYEGSIEAALTKIKRFYKNQLFIRKE